MTDNTDMTIDTDVLIVGGGLVGSLLANALLEIPVRAVVVETRDVAQLEQPSFDGRATALANGTRRILDGLGLWDAMQDAAEPIEHIHIGQRGRFGVARIHAVEEGVAALGYTVENRAMGEALWAALAGRENFTCLSPATLTNFRAGAEDVTAGVDCGDRRLTVRAQLLVAADGARSSVRAALGISAHAVEYGQKAVIANCTMQYGHRGWAFERFTRTGPIAMLPLTGGRCAIVWSLATAHADAALEWTDEQFIAELLEVFGRRLGRVLRIGRRAAHPLTRLRSDALTGPRSVLIGNAAISMHPVAGQSFNLAVRDVATLAEVIADACHGQADASFGAAVDIGDAALLERYRTWRRADQRNVSWFTHGLVTGMGLALPGVPALRDIGLIAFDLLPGAKRTLARHTMGLAGRVPRLARGLTL